jgi:hypothetical protein
MTIKEFRYLLAFALVGACIAGSIFGFWIKGNNLEAVRLIGASILSLTAYFFKWYQLEI